MLPIRRILIFKINLYILFEENAIFCLRNDHSRSFWKNCFPPPHSPHLTPVPVFPSVLSPGHPPLSVSHSLPSKAPCISVWFCKQSIWSVEPSHAEKPCRAFRQNQSPLPPSRWKKSSQWEGSLSCHLAWWSSL